MKAKVEILMNNRRIVDIVGGDKPKGYVCRINRSAYLYKKKDDFFSLITEKIIIVKKKKNHYKE